MPISRLLQDKAFRPDEIAPIVAAYQDALAALKLTACSNDPILEVVARKIVEIVEAGDRDRAQIYTKALGSLGISHPPLAREIADLDQNAGMMPSNNVNMEWNPIASAPFDRDLELAVIDYEGIHALVFPCRRILRGWVDSGTKKQIANLRPTHWREWQVSS